MPLTRVLVASPSHAFGVRATEALERSGIADTASTTLSGRAALGLIRELDPQLVLLDVARQHDTVVALVHALRESGHPARILLLSSEDANSVSVAMDALLTGADELVLLPEESRLLDAGFLAAELLPAVLALLLPYRRFAPVSERPATPMESMSGERGRGVPLLVLLAPVNALSEVRSLLPTLTASAAPLLVWTTLPAHLARVLAERLAACTGHEVRDAANLAMLGHGSVTVMAVDALVTVHDGGDGRFCLSVPHVDARYASALHPADRLVLAAGVAPSRLLIYTLGAPAPAQLASVVQLHAQGVRVTAVGATPECWPAYADATLVASELSVAAAEATALSTRDTGLVRSRNSDGVQPW